MVSQTIVNTLEVERSALWQTMLALEHPDNL